MYLNRFEGSAQVSERVLTPYHRITDIEIEHLGPIPTIFFLTWVQTVQFEYTVAAVLGFSHWKKMHGE